MHSDIKWWIFKTCTLIVLIGIIIVFNYLLEYCKAYPGWKGAESGKARTDFKNVTVVFLHVLHV